MLLIAIVLLSYSNPVAARFTPYRTTVTTSNEILSEYDFVIVGGGSAGSLLASRLSEIPQWKILVVEAGEDEAFLSDIPSAGIFLQSTQFNWKFKNNAGRPFCLAYANEQCKAPRGKVLGGTGVLNNMVYSRCHRKDYDEWASMGNPGWSFEQVLPYFLKTENNKIPEYRDSPFHSSHGDLSVERVPFRTELATAFLEAGKELGYEVVDYNAGDNFGFSLLQVNMINGTRCSGNRAFLSKASRRNNLDVVILAQVTKILIEPRSKRVWGVEFVKKGRTFRIAARKEVILCAGVFNSAKLLMLSGIGPRKHLQELGIPLVQDLPVGQTIRDHYGFIGTMFRINSSAGITLDKVMNIDTVVKYFQHDGYLTIPGTEAIAFIRSKYAVDERPDLELVFIPSATGVEFQALKVLGIREDFFRSYYNQYRNLKMWSLSTYLLRPNSTGFMKLRSRNPFDDPIIEANFFSDPGDVEVLVDGIKQGLRLAKTNSFARYKSEIADAKIPGCEAHKFGSDEYWRCGVRQLTIEIHHQTGTCQMGPMCDKTSVVDHKLRVHGVHNLRVADTSVIPVKLSGHPNAPVYMIAEKAADFLKADWLGPYKGKT